MKLRIVLIALLSMFLFSAAQGLAGDFPDVENLYFSTEEDFVTKSQTSPFQVVSDGDLLNWQGTIFMRNNALLQKFDELNDLGLDAADVISTEERLVAFSTELDSTHGIFSAGDLLATNGARIPNKALLINFNFPFKPTDLGLDAVQFKGRQEMIMEYLDYVASKGWGYYDANPLQLLEDLREFNIDIWFSTEGTAPNVWNPMFLDGDLLSALHGTIVISNSNLLPLSVPAGIPNRGVDFGLDAFVTFRLEDGPMYFSTEILFNGEKFPFTDGDVLRAGGTSVSIPHFELIFKFYPPVDFIGVDALSCWEK